MTSYPLYCKNPPIRIFMVFMRLCTDTAGITVSMPTEKPYLSFISVITSEPLGNVGFSVLYEGFSSKIVYCGKIGLKLEDTESASCIPCNSSH